MVQPSAAAFAACPVCMFLHVQSLPRCYELTLQKSQNRCWLHVFQGGSDRGPLPPKRFYSCYRIGLCGAT